MDAAAVREEIRSQAVALGFAEARFTTADADPALAADLAAYLEQGRHGDMAWMADTFERRVAPRALWDAVRSVVVLGENYGPACDPRTDQGDGARGAISVYAQGRDYHDLVKKRLKALARFMVARFGCDVKVFVDTAPVMEKPLAARAGLGWQGRHTNLVSRRFGSWLFLGEVFTTLDLPPDPPEHDRCGRCHACEAVCPTGALGGGRIDPRRCISYLTIEHRGVIPAALRARFGNRIYGCDACLAVCPWNHFARIAAEPGYRPRSGPSPSSLAELAALDDGAFRLRFAGSPIKRIGLERMLRNVLIAIGNSGDAALAPSAVARLSDPSPVVRGAAVWAVRRLLPADTVRRLQTERLAVEADGTVRREWDRDQAGSLAGRPSESR